MKLVWNPPEVEGIIDGYVVRYWDEADPSKVFNYATPGPFLLDFEKTLNLTPGHRYAFTVAAFNIYGEGPQTDQFLWEYKAPYAPPADALPEKKDYFVIALPPGLLTQL
jgi:hypothetical protein